MIPCFTQFFCVWHKLYVEMPYFSSPMLPDPICTQVDTCIKQQSQIYFNQNVKEIKLYLAMSS